MVSFLDHFKVEPTTIEGCSFLRYEICSKEFSSVNSA